MFAVLFRDAEADGGRPVPWSIIAVWDTFAQAELHAAMLRRAGFCGSLAQAGVATSAMTEIPSPQRVAQSCERRRKLVRRSDAERTK